MIRALILITAVILASCDGGFNDGKDKRTKPESGKIVARIGSSHITEQQLRDAVESLPVKQRILIESSREQKDRFVESYINKEILYREALKRGYGEKEDIKKSVEDYKKKIVIRKLSEDLLKLEITDSQLEQYYEENKEKYKAALITQVSVTPRDKDNVDTDKLQGFLKTIKTRLQKDESLDDPSNNTLYNVKIKKAAEVRRDK
ncbi:MAG: hypothetical protein GWO07_08840 [Candidatus Dadabacteria bacterium]|nr:hypothetical protein [Candidatus Dadabacteria bacterium]NIS08852.1 hypothetical protein [Candidatus Dadabacteria bacterium]NIV42802.1 hypothetical protein [Candidatus Dadabacteria bacterium]NIX16115.1 hypothetical protein [Candidatus Dadabacteria bacterium]NIY22202.1 hypothetical protein [Candidatus Dadabacteria bacterium]